MKVMKRNVDRLIWELINIEDIPFDRVPGRGTDCPTDATTFIICHF